MTPDPDVEMRRLERLVPHFGGMSGASLRRASAAATSDPGRPVSRSAASWLYAVLIPARAWR